MSLLIWLKMNHEVDYQPTETFTSTFTYYTIYVYILHFTQQSRDGSESIPLLFLPIKHIDDNRLFPIRDTLLSKLFAFITSLNVEYMYIHRKKKIFFLRVKLKTDYINFTDYFD